jgi:large subunit ribosomal protein L22
MEARAVAKFVRIGPRKVRRYLPLVRGKHVEEALAALAIQSSPSTETLRKCIASAAANAEENHDMSADELWVSEARVDEGFRIPRLKPRARGRADRIHKPTCHITIVVSDASDENEE